MEFQ